MTFLQYNFAERMDSQRVCEQLHLMLSRNFSAELSPHDPVGDRMQKQLRLMEFHPAVVTDEIIKSEERFAARHGKGFQIICKYRSSRIVFNVCEICVQVFSPLDIDAESAATIRGILSSLGQGKLDEEIDALKKISGGRVSMNENFHSSFVDLVHEGPDAIENYLASGGDVNYQDFFPVLGDGRSMLHEAAVSGLLDIVKLLLSRGADINLLSLSLQSPLWEACSAGKTEVALHLIAAGADINSRNVGGYTPLGRVPGENLVLIDAMSSAGATI